jgi:CheY-like chemotaxis protein
VGSTEPRSVWSHAADETANKDTKALRILLVEDNEVNRRVATGMLERLGCVVQAAGDGREALTKFDHGQYDVILMDVQMPEMDGFAATAAIRNREHGTARHVPIIAMTAHAMQGDRERCLASGMDGYITKPVRTNALRDVLHANGRPASNGAARRDIVEFHSFCVKTLEESCGHDPILIREVLQLMLRDIPPRLERLQAAVSARDDLQVAWEAHGLKGAFLTVGAEALARTCQDLMSMIENGISTTIGMVHQPIQDQWGSLETEVLQYLESASLSQPTTAY